MPRKDTNSHLFRYDGLDPTIVKLLKGLETTIQRNGRSTINAMQSIGLALLDAKTKLNHGKFKDWVVSQCGICIRTAERYMRAAEFLEDKYDTVSHLQSSTIYRLSAKGISPSVVESVLLSLRDQPSLTDLQVNALIDQALQATRPEATQGAEASPINALIQAWKSASKRERQTFASAHKDELLELLATGVGESSGIFSDLVLLLPAPSLDPSSVEASSQAADTKQAGIEASDRRAQADEVLL
jgi:hypothetical protein